MPSGAHGNKGVLGCILCRDLWRDFRNKTPLSCYAPTKRIRSFRSEFHPFLASSPHTCTSPCRTTPPPTGAYCHGDPHCRTFDGLQYDCHGDGDFVLLNSAETGSVVHARFQPLISPSNSFATGVVATEDDSSVIEVTVDDGHAPS